MGLDIYLYRYENKQETEALEAQYEKQSDAHWNFNNRKYEDITITEREEIRRKDETFALSLGLNKDGSDPRKESIKFPSEKYPDHYFKIGYFRSSYNGGGINNILRNLGLPTLYEIFNRQNEDEYVWQPDWQLALANVMGVIDQLKVMPNRRCFTIAPNMFIPNETRTIASELDALRVYSQEREKNHAPEMDGYSNRDGYFYHNEPLKVFGLVQGVRKKLFGDDIEPCVYVVTEGDNKWYVNALEIVQETIEYVLAQPNKDKYFLHWSS